MPRKPVQGHCRPLQAPGPGEPVKLELAKHPTAPPRLEPSTSASQSVMSATEPLNVLHYLKLCIYRNYVQRVQNLKYIYTYSTAGPGQDKTHTVKNCFAPAGIEPMTIRSNYRLLTTRLQHLSVQALRIYTCIFCYFSIGA